MNRITIVAALDGYTGYGLHLQHMVRGFRALGLFPSIRKIKHHGSMPGGLVAPDISQCLVAGQQPEGWEVLLSPPNILPTPGKRVAYVTMYEGSVLPDPQKNMLASAEIVIVPCHWNKECFIKSGVTRPIHVVPLGADSKIFHYRPMSMEGPTVFACAGRTRHGRERKGLDAVIRSFLAAFPYDKNVRLKVKCHADCQLPNVSDPRIEVTREHLPESKVADWLTSATCFVSAACGEGWGLWQHQAMACGRPVIAACYGGLQEFMGCDNSFPVNYLERPASEHFGGLWAIPDLESMVEQMRFVHGNRSNALITGTKASRDVEHLTWDMSVRMTANILSGYRAIERGNWSGQFLARRTTQGDYTPGRIASVLEQCKSKGWEAHEWRFEKAPGECVFNPTVFESNGENVWLARSSGSDNGNRDNSHIFAFREIEIGSDKSRWNHTRKRLNLHGFDGDWFEDPRACADGDGMAVSYTRVTKGGFATQEIAFLNEDFSVRDVWHPDYGKNGATPRAATGPEKNWVIFNHDGIWHVIYSIEPMIVLRVEGGKVTKEYKTDAFNPNWRHGIERHGGGPPTRIGDFYYGFHHTRMPWFGRDRNRYFIAAYAFEAKPPFRITRMSREPLLRSDDVYQGTPCSCVIAGGAVFKDDMWTLAVGARDLQCIKIEIPHRDVMAGMDDV